MKRKKEKLSVSLLKNLILLLIGISFVISTFIVISKFLIPSQLIITNENILMKDIYNRYLYQITLLLVVNMLLCSFLIIIYAVITTKMIKRPLRQIDEALNNIIDGNYEQKLEINGASEFVVVNNTINYLTEKLKNVSEEKTKLENSKNAMLLDLSHDIKTPITSIRGFSQALYDGMIKDEAQKIRYYKNILDKSERVAELVDDLFEFVRMDSSQYILKLESVDINEYIRQIVLSYYDEIEEKEFELEVNIKEEPVIVKIDVKIYKRVIINLIENALKYNPKGTKIRVEVRNTSKYVVVEVGDNGIGIEKTIRNKIFDAFVRVDTSRTSSGGSGLGLAIAHKIVENHGGEIALLNGRGKEKTIFHIKICK